MSDLAVLVAVVLAIYIFQCIIWAPARANVFRASFLRGAKRLEHPKPQAVAAKAKDKPGARSAAKASTKAPGVVANKAAKKKPAIPVPAAVPDFPRDGRRASRGFMWNALSISGFWANPLPVDALMVANWPAACLDPAGLVIEGEPAPIPWEQLKLIRAGHKLKSGNFVVLSGPEKQLRDFEKLASELGKVQPNARAAIIEKWLRAAFDVAAAEERYAAFRSPARSLTILACMQFAVLFWIVPWIFYRIGTRAIWNCLALVLCVSLFTAFEFWQAHKHFYPEAGDARWTQSLTIVLSPLSAIRAMDTLARDLLAGFHPVTAAAVVCSKDEFAALAGEQLRELSFATISSATHSAWWNESLTRALQSVVTKRGLSAENLLAAPSRQQGCDVYCPRCLAQYLATREACTDCGYEGLVRFGAK